MSYNVLRGCAELNITRVCQMSSLNAIGATYTPHQRIYDSFPIDEKSIAKPADPYSLSKLYISSLIVAVLCNNAKS